MLDSHALLELGTGAFSVPLCEPSVPGGNECRLRKKAANPMVLRMSVQRADPLAVVLLSTVVVTPLVDIAQSLASVDGLISTVTFLQAQRRAHRHFFTCSPPTLHYFY